MKRSYNFYDRYSQPRQNLQNEYMAYKLSNAKPLVNINCPESYIFHKTQFIRTLPNNNISKINLLTYTYYYL